MVRLSYIYDAWCLKVKLGERGQSKQFVAKYVCRVHIVITKLNTLSKILSAENRLILTAREEKNYMQLFEMSFFYLGHYSLLHP